MMKKMISILGALGALVGSAYAASDLVWSAADGHGTIRPVGWYTYKDPKDNKVISVDTSTTATAKEIIATVSKNVETSVGVGFGWGANNAVKDLSAYKGVCLEYSSTAAFRLDMKQSTITDGNYNGFLVPAQSGIDFLFIPFDDMTQEDWGDATKTKAFDPTKQTGMQFSYKKAIAVEEGATANIIKIASISLGTSCTNTPPNLKTGVVANDEAELYEGDTLKVAFKEIFEDIDGDDLNIVMTAGEGLVDLKGAKSYSLSDVAMLKSTPNPDDGATAKVSFVAKDVAGASVTYSITVSLIDRINPPKANDDAYEVDEDAVLTVGAKQSLMANDIDDDGDSFKITSYTEPENGELKFTVMVTGTFTYTPNPDFHGIDTFTYVITDANEQSDTATVTITVKNVDDPATVVVVDSTFYIDDILEENAVKFSTGITVEEDFAPFSMFIADTSIVFTDPDVGSSSFKANAKSVNGLVEVEYMPLGGTHVMTISPVADANGKDKIMLFVADGKDTVGVTIPITITPVADVPKAVDDTYTVAQVEKNSVDAKMGVLANDINPDGKSALKAYLVKEPAKGTLTLDTTGAFIYEVGEFEGSDTFTYVAVNAEGDSSLPATVTLTVVYKNRAPAVAAGVEDTVGTRLANLREDFATSVTFRAAEVMSWFADPEKDKFSVTIANPDSMLEVSINTAGAITVKHVMNACGETFFEVIATDTLKNSSKLTIPASIECVNDKPSRIGGASDTVYMAPNGWVKAFSVFDLFEDPDDTVLVMKVSSIDKVLGATIEGDSLFVQLANETQYLQDKVPYVLKVTATDAAGEVSVPKSLVFMANGEKASIRTIAAAPKTGWQGAIRAERGVAMMFDMQGRVMWKAKLPVSEADVRNASAKVQGRKVLMVNKQTWTIK